MTGATSYDVWRAQGATCAGAVKVTAPASGNCAAHSSSQPCFSGQREQSRSRAALIAEIISDDFNLKNRLTLKAAASVGLDDAEMAEELERLEQRMGGIKLMVLTHRDDVADHAEVGVAMGIAWNLPSNIVSAMRYHHRPDRCDPHQPIVDCVHVGDYFTMELGLGLGVGNLRYEFFDSALSRLAIPATETGRLQEALANAVRHGCKGDPSKHVQCVLTCDANQEIVIDQLARELGMSVSGFHHHFKALTAMVASPDPRAGILTRRCPPPRSVPSWLVVASVAMLAAVDGGKVQLAAVAATPVGTDGLVVSGQTGVVALAAVL